MTPLRVGMGFDAHRFSPTPPIKLGGIVVDSTRGLEATSDGDVAAHALADALLGAAGLGDLGELFPSSDPKWHGADSMVMLEDVWRLVQAAGWQVASADLTIVAQDLRITPHREAIRTSFSELLKVDVSVKATTTDRMGFIGRSEGLAALAVTAVTI